MWYRESMLFTCLFFSVKNYYGKIIVEAKVKAISYVRSLKCYKKMNNLKRYSVMRSNIGE